ncbi:MAG: DNA-3-methyladenine glycosylase I [Chthoniobacterales bacterium]|nr:DNA-3-methyladenine glycosylase I [Chthoniobacterales bacterium]
MSYCTFIKNSILPKREIHKRYHDTQHGFPLNDDNEIFGRLLLEINQAGLSWEIILKKEASLRKAYDDFDILTIASYDETEVTRLLKDRSIIRHRLKIHAAIKNAQTVLKLKEEYGSFLLWLQAHHPRSQIEWISLFKKTFFFTGGEIVNEFLISIGILEGAHNIECPIYQPVLAAHPWWHETSVLSL